MDPEFITRCKAELDNELDRLNLYNLSIDETIIVLELAIEKMNVDWELNLFFTELRYLCF